MLEPLAASWYRTRFLWVLEVWQLPLILLLVGLILYWRHMRNKQV